MYLPPPGRPISTPPNDAISTPHSPNRGHRYTPEQKAAIRADYKAGMSYADLKAKYGLVHNKSLARLVADIANRRTDKVKNAKPVREKGESHQAYGSRVWQWKCQNDPEWAKEVQAKRVASYKATMRKRRLAKLRHERAIERAKAEDAAVQATVDFDNAHMDDAPVMPPPTLWQRIVGWFR